MTREQTKERVHGKVRGEAALICAIAASGGAWVVEERRWSSYYARIADELELSSDSRRLAVKAYNHIMAKIGGPWTREVDAEAEALLRTGWSP